MLKNFKWHKQKLEAEAGILIASDLSQEWLLPWWWEHYAQFNPHPVAFVDLGMSQEMKEWCQKRGLFIPLLLPDTFVAEKATMDPKLIRTMEEACGTTFWPSRSAWFKKALACLQSPFQRTVWIDLDCEIRGPIRPLFSYGLALAKEHFTEAVYNSGVIVFSYHEPLIEMWAEHSFCHNHLFRGDQDVLNALIQKHAFSITPLPSLYNWSRMRGENSQAIIVHWHGPQGKQYISHQITCNNLRALGIIS